MVKKNKDPMNPFKPRTMLAALYEEDFSDLDVSQVAEVFSTTSNSVRRAICLIEQKTGKKVVLKSKYSIKQKGE